MDMWQSFIGNPKKGCYSIGEAIWLNIRMFLAAGVLILVLALVLALIRQSPGPVLFPLRVLSLIYVDYFRGVPLLLVVYAIGLGVHALGLPGLPPRRRRSPRRADVRAASCAYRRWPGPTRFRRRQVSQTKTAVSTSCIAMS